MAIIPASRSSEPGLEIVQQALKDLEPQPESLGGGVADISHPLAIYRLGLDDVAEPDSLTHARFIGWRYLIEGGGQTTGTADVGETDAGDLRFANLARNEQADLLLEATHLAQAAASLEKADCEARLLIVPSLYVTAVWLTTSPPLFIPVLGASRPIRERSDLDVRSNFLEDLAERAEVAKGHRISSEGFDDASPGIAP